MGTTRSLSLRGAIATAVATTFTLGSAVASAQVLEEVIVTAQKREQNLQDVPIAVSAFGGEMLAESGVKDMLDLQSNAPSLIVTTNQTSTATTFGIRGVFTSSQNFGLEPSVGLYVDGVYRARQGSMINNLVDVANVEVLRGPQGTLFGRNTPAGAIQIFSVKPDFEGSGFLEGTYGDYDLMSFSGAKSLTLIEDELAVRATGFYMERDGFVDDIGIEVPQDEAYNDRDRWGVRLQGLWTPNDDLTVHVILDRSEIEETCCGFGVWKNNLFAQDLPPGSPPKTGTDVRIAELGGTVLRQEDFYDYETASSFLPASESEDQGLSVQVDWQTDNFLLTSITAYRDFESFDNIDADFADIDALVRINEAEQDAFTQELRISNDYEKWNYVAGLYYYKQNLDSDTDTIVGDDITYLLQDQGAFGNAFVGGSAAFNSTEQEHQSYAIFGQADYSLSESWVLTAGLRWTKEDKDIVNVFTEDAPDCNFFEDPTCPPLQDNWGFYFFPPLTPRDDVDETIDDDQVTGTIKLTWFALEDIMFYASYGTGYKAGGTNTDRIDQAIDVVFDAETSDAFEMGMKADFPEQAMRLNVALHRTDTDDLQTISFQGTGFALQNAGVAETYGAEVDLYWQATENLNVTLAYAYNHAEYADFEEGDCWISTPWHTDQPDPGQNPDGTCDRSGGDVSSNPENVVVLSANQRFNLGSEFSGFIYGEYIYTDERMTDVNNDPAKYDGSYDLVNLRAGLVWERYDAELILWGRNVFDEEYVTTIADKVGQDGALVAYHNEPGTWGLTARWNF